MSSTPTADLLGLSSPYESDEALARRHSLTSPDRVMDVLESMNDDFQKLTMINTSAAVIQYPDILSDHHHNHHYDCRPVSPSGVIGPKTKEGMTSCPCCNQPKHDRDTTLGVLPPTPTSATHTRRLSRQKSLLDGTLDDSDDEEEETEYSRQFGFGKLSSGTYYKPKRCLVEGWVHKKGTGNDWRGCKSWKARYMKLVLAKVDGHDVDVPLLLIYWFPQSPEPSTVISLDSAVVMPVDLPDKTEWNSYCFNVIHTKSMDESSNKSSVPRTFTAPEKGRDAWVYAINKALLKYSKDMQKAKEEQAKQPSPYQFRPLSPARGGASGIRRLEEDCRPSFHRASSSPLIQLSPPSSPRPTEKRPLPRPVRAVSTSPPTTEDIQTP